MQNNRMKDNFAKIQHATVLIASHAAFPWAIGLKRLKNCPKAEF
jgi:hypothetical protein